MGVPVIVGDIPPGDTLAATVVLIPGSRGALFEGAKGSCETVRGVGCEFNECGVAIALMSQKEYTRL